MSSLEGPIATADSDENWRWTWIASIGHWNDSRQHRSWQNLIGLGDDCIRPQSADWVGSRKGWNVINRGIVKDSLPDWSFISSGSHKFLKWKTEQIKSYVCNYVSSQIIHIQNVYVLEPLIAIEVSSFPPFLVLWPVVRGLCVSRTVNEVMPCYKLWPRFAV